MIIEIAASDNADVHHAADALEALIDGWDSDATVSRKPAPPQAHADGEDKVDPVSIAALIVSIPAALLAVADLADRITKRRRAKQLVDHARTIRETTGAEVIVVLADGRRPLETVDPDELLEQM